MECPSKKSLQTLLLFDQMSGDTTPHLLSLSGIGGKCADVRDRGIDPIVEGMVGITSSLLRVGVWSVMSTMYAF